MADLHKAIRTIHTDVVSINGDTQETIVATDNMGNEITIDWTQVNAWTDPDEYKYKRAEEYPSIKQQLDKIYHEGIDEWKKLIKVTKDKYPKG
jgi:hypothetical protein